MTPKSPSETTLARGPSTLLIGPPGSGKTYSLVTYIEAGLELFVLVTDPAGVLSLLKAMHERDLPIDKLHWHYVPAASESWDTLMTAAKLVRDLSYESLTHLKGGSSKEGYAQWLDMLSVMANFTCERTGEEFGPVDSWGPDRAFALDGTSGLNRMAYSLMVGNKPTAHQGEWGVAMRTEERFFAKFCADIKCFRCMVAHVEVEPDMISGVPKVMMSALGRKLAPNLPKDFSDVAICIREGKKFFWSTTESNTDLKSGSTLPLEAKLTPTFVQVVDAWKTQGAIINPEAYTKKELENA